MNHNNILYLKNTKNASGIIMGDRPRRTHKRPAFFNDYSMVDDEKKSPAKKAKTKSTKTKTSVPEAEAVISNTSQHGRTHADASSTVEAAVVKIADHDAGPSQSNQNEVPAPESKKVGRGC